MFSCYLLTLFVLQFLRLIQHFFIATFVFLPFLDLSSLSLPVSPFIFLIISCYFLHKLIGWLTFYSSSALSTAHPAVFITGCDPGGFGERLSVHLYHKGFRVFSACYLSCSISFYSSFAPPRNSNKQLQPFIHAFPLDLTSLSDIERVYELIHSMTLNSGGLYGIINNAGIFDSSLVEFTPLSSYRNSLEVNLLGCIAITKRFLPLLTVCSQAPRVLVISSFLGRISTVGLSAYSASKFALEGFSDALRAEIQTINVKVTVVELCTMNTNMNKLIGFSLLKHWENSNEKLKQKYETKFGKKFIQQSNKVMKWLGLMNDQQQPIKLVTKCLMAKFPPARVSCGLESLVINIMKYLPIEERLVDLMVHACFQVIGLFKS
jgi:short-subunit dehydrogenase